ncbi:hypothetical protein [Undibacterium fentianense]|uniref:YqjK-like protein n=1 Tax=Undibacterium fentianense TaxID=2828728 RepID=A0A941E4S1_9BURK|nr:hypothetical protein [Undibacterium fentianense]MBR7800936.1 hypothetical protein [Undibacterium fentianense]
MTEQSKHQQNQATSLVARKKAVLERCRQQREQLIWQAAQIHHELKFVELGLQVASTIRFNVRHSPLVTAASVAASVAALYFAPRTALYRVVKIGLRLQKIWHYLPTDLKNRLGAGIAACFRTSARDQDEQVDKPDY